MTDPTCVIAECARPQQKREWCKMHYNRLLLAGEMPRLPKLTKAERFWAKVQKTATCWNWTASKDKDGYGHFLIQKNGRNYSEVAHRIAYKMEVGPIPEGMQIDHRCHNRACVNPAHLRVATNKQNMEHRVGAQRNNVTSGIRGVHWNTRIGKWRAVVRHNAQDHHLGYFEDVSEAERVVIAKRNELFTHNDLDRLSAAINTAQ